MPRVASLALAVLLAATPAAAAPSCPIPAARAYAACLAHGVPRCGSKACARRATRERLRLRQTIMKRCTPASIQAADYPPPFDATPLAARLERSCVANAEALLGRAADVAAGDGVCARVLGRWSLRQAARTFVGGYACTGSGPLRECPGSSKLKLPRCRGVAVPDGAITGLLARARAQSRCAVADVVPGPPIADGVRSASTCAPSGPEALVDLWRLPAPRPAGTRATQTSSYDRGGGNVDLGIGPDTAALLPLLNLPPVEIDFSYLYRDGERYVIFDEAGPGVVWRIWMTGLDGLLNGKLGGDIAFELDDEATPRLTLTREQLFAGTTAPFLAPLAGDAAVSSGGYYSVVPIPFARRLRITTSTVPNWVQIDCTHLASDQAVASFDPAADTSPVAALLARAGERDTAVAADAEDIVALDVAAGATQVVWQRDLPHGIGTIVALELLAPADADVPTGLRLRATFDGAAAPQVDAPLDDLFGASLGPGARSVAFGRDGDRYYLYLPMPFHTGARLEVTNGGPDPVAGWTLRIGRVDRLPPGSESVLHAAAAAATPSPDGRDYVMLDAPGVGHVVGVVLTAGCGGAGLCQLGNLPGVDGSHLEGDERIAVDGSRWPQWHGTGLEDFFGGGFYFVRGPFTRPTHGNPAQVSSTSPRRPGLNLRNAYRFLAGDAIPFRGGIRLAIEHGPIDDVPAAMSSLVFYYAATSGGWAETDRLAIGDAAAEAAHALTVEGRTDLQLTSTFRGDDHAPLAATGMTATVTRLRLTIDPGNLGVRLRRLADLGGGRQVARLTVDGADAGIWRTSDVNLGQRWADLDVELPGSLTGGRSQIDVEIDARDSPTPWTAFEYVALSELF